MAAPMPSDAPVTYEEPKTEGEVELTEVALNKLNNVAPESISETKSTTSAYSCCVPRTSQVNVTPLEKRTANKALNRTFSRPTEYKDEELPSLSCRALITGFFRVVLAYFYAMGFVLGGVIVLATLISVSFLLSKSLQQPEYTNAAAVWIMLAPWIMILFALLMETALGLIADTLVHSPLIGINTHDKRLRFKFIYSITGGERPLLLHFRSSMVALLAAGCLKKKATVLHPTTEKQVEPLFQVPEWIVLTVECIFYFLFVVFPFVYTFFIGGLRYEFYSYTSAFKTIMMFGAMITTSLQCLMNIVIYFWPRAALFVAFVEGSDAAITAFGRPVRNINIYPYLITKVDIESGSTAPAETTVTTVQEWEDAQYLTFDSDTNNDERKAIETLLQTSRVQFYDSTIKPRDFGVLGEPTDRLWVRCCSKIPPCVFGCQHCCINEKSARFGCVNEKRRFQLGIVALCLYFLLIGLSFAKFDGVLFICQFLTMVVVCAFGSVVPLVLPGVVGRAFYGTLLLLVGFQINWMVISSFTSETLLKQEEIQYVRNMTMNTALANEKKRGWPAPTRKMLPVCDLRWGVGNVVSVLDVGVLISGIYNNDQGMSSVLKAMHGGPLSDAHLNKTVVQEKGVGKSESTWQRWDFPSAKTSVYVFRGTATTADAMQDVGSYAMSGPLQVLSFLLPLDKIVPQQVVMDLMDLMSHDSFDYTAYVAALEDLKTFQKTHPTDEWTIMTAGHSLGGIYANIVGALASVPTLAFSPPGLLHISQQAGIKDIERAKSFVTSIVATGDPVGMVDSPIGTVAEIPCTAPISNFASYAQCHAPDRTLSMLVLACPDFSNPTRQWEISNFDLTTKKKKWFMGAPPGEKNIVASPKGWNEKMLKVV